MKKNKFNQELKTEPNKPQWLLFVLSVTGQHSALRMRSWRALKALGTVVMRDGVYLLPNNQKFREAFEVIERDVSAEGSVQLLELNARDEKQQQEFESFFDRTADYELLLGEIKSVRKKLSKLKADAIGGALDRLRSEMEAISTIDFFPRQASAQTKLALDELITDANAILSPDEPHLTIGNIQKLNIKDYRGRTWATRQRPWVDRLASAWLIQRFIDPKATIIWLEKPRDCPKDALGFDFDGAAFTHIGSRVTFEVLAASFDLDNDPAIEQIGALVHYLDVGGIPVAESAGVEAVLRGARSKHTDDDVLLNEVIKLFDFLYDSFTDKH